MRIFGKRANQESAKEGVPPELQPYFDGNTGMRRLRLVAPLLIAIVLAAVIIGVSLWIRNHRVPTKVNQPATSGQQATTPNQSTTSQPSPAPTGNQPSTSNQPTSTPPKKPPTPAPSASSELLNTGPGDTALYTALAVTVLGMLGYHVKQSRALRRS